MAQLLGVFLLVTFAMSGVFARAEEKWQFREVVFEVRDLLGKPAPGVKVFLAGVERDALDRSDDEIGAGKNWNFVTDAKGCFTARFGRFQSSDYREAMHESLPAYGGFYMVAESPGTAGGVSPI